MREIRLTQGKVALVDDEDYDSIVAMGEWCYHSGYAARTDNKNKVTVRMHRIILGTPEGMDTDHKNHDRLDNRKANLRICTSSQNSQNRRRTVGKSKYKGVTWHKQRKKWWSHIRVNGKKLFLGYYKDESEAGKAYDKAALKYFGEYACLNFLR